MIIIVMTIVVIIMVVIIDENVDDDKLTLVSLLSMLPDALVGWRLPSCSSSIGAGGGRGDNGGDNNTDVVL